MAVRTLVLSFKQHVTGSYAMSNIPIGAQLVNLLETVQYYPGIIAESIAFSVRGSELRIELDTVVEWRETFDDSDSKGFGRALVAAVNRSEMVDREYVDLESVNITFE